MGKVRVLPARDVLTGDGYVWEHVLDQAGWNALSPADKVGEIVGLYDLDMGGTVVDVFWPALDITSVNIFRGEIRPLTESEEKETKK